MKTITKLYILALVFLIKSISSAVNILPVLPSPIELVLNCGNLDTTIKTPSYPYSFVSEVEFSSITNMAIEVTFRNVSEKSEFWPDVLIPNLSIVWDGKEYLQPKSQSSWSEVAVKPKSLMSHYFFLSDFTIPPEARTHGRHTIAVRDKNLESSTLTIFIDTPK